MPESEIDGSRPKNRGIAPSPALALVRRDLLVLVRGDRFFEFIAILSVTLLGLSALFLMFTEGTNESLANLGRKLFRTQLVLLFLTAITIVPSVASTTLAAERRQNCIPLLFTTLIRPGWIVWAKALACFTLFFIVYAACMPYTGLAYFFAGVEIATFFQGALLIMGTAWCTACIGLASSSVGQDQTQTVVHTQCAVVLMLILPWIGGVLLNLIAMPAGPLKALESAVGSDLSSYLIYLLAKFVAWGKIVGELLLQANPFRAFGTVWGGIPNWTPTVYCAVYQGGLSLFLLYRARRHVLPVRDPSSRRLFRRARPSSKKARGAREHIPIPDGKNPVAIKDYRCNTLSQGYRPYALGFAGVLIGGLVPCVDYAIASWGTPNALFSGGFCTSGERLFLILSIPTLVIAHYKNEEEHDTLDALRLSLLDEMEFLRGKVGGAWRTLAPILGGAVAAKGGLLLAAPALGAWYSLELLLLATFNMTAYLMVAHGTTLISLRGAVCHKSVAAAIIATFARLLFFLGLSASLGAIGLTFLEDFPLTVWRLVGTPLFFYMLARVLALDTANVFRRKWSTGGA